MNDNKIIEYKVDKSANIKWENSNKSLDNYIEYIEKKKDKFSLTLIDLLYISNFKGGNASIHEEENKLNPKLKKYSEILKEINEKFCKKKLSELNNEEYKLLENIINKIIDSCYDNETSINGFKISFLSALFHAYFQELIPILDRRVLINLEIVSKSDLDSQKQVKHIKKYYLPLICKFKEISTNEKKSIRDIDKEYFMKPLITMAQKIKKELKTVQKI